MLAIDAARASGFRDSLYFFRRNPLALKLSATQPEKEFLISAGKLGAHLKTRSVTLVTARSAYKLHGAKMILGMLLFFAAKPTQNLLFLAIDGRWVTDDYYESKCLTEITEKGLKPGDLVGELPDPLGVSSQTAPSGQQPTTSTSSGIYRAGGPTTIFGGTGWGPFSDGPHSAVRKSLLTREGLTEENWMFEAARRVGDAGEEWTRMRRKARVACGGILGDGLDKGKGKEVQVAEGEEKRGATEELEGAERKRSRAEDSQYPLGVYEPHTGLVHCMYISIIFSPCFYFIFSRSRRHSTHPLSLGTNWTAEDASRIEGGEWRLGACVGRYTHRIAHAGRIRSICTNESRNSGGNKGGRPVINQILSPLFAQWKWSCGVA